MSRPIDADKLKRKVQKYATEAWKMNLTARIETVLNQFIDWIDDAPTVEPERKKGKWRTVTKKSNLFDAYRCSECNKLVYGKTNFCPNCGCEMER
jgi:rubrerythrin